MKISQSRIHHLNLYVFITLLTHEDSEAIQQKIHHHIYQTVYVGDTVTLYCNTTLHDKDITWKMNNSAVFSYNSFNKRNMTKFTSDRMDIKSSAPEELRISEIQTSDAGNYSCYSTETSMRWVLTVTDYSRITENTLKQHLILYISVSCAGVIMVCLMIGVIVCIHRRKSNRDADHGSQAPASRRTSAKKSFRCSSEVKRNDPNNYSIYINVPNIK